MRSVDYNKIIPERRGDESELEYDGRVSATKKGLTKLYTDVLKGSSFVADMVKGISSPEQHNISKIAYWLDKNEKTEVLSDFVNEFGQDGLRTFIYLQANENFSRNIIEFADRFPEDAKTVFQNYALLLDATDDVRKIVESKIDCANHDCEVIISTMQSQIISQASRTLQGSVQSTNAQALNTQIHNYRIDARKLVALVESLSPEQIRNHLLDRVPSSELQPIDVAQMLAMTTHNYRNETPAFREMVVTSLETSVHDPDNTFYILHDPEVADSDNIAGFCRFEEQLDQQGRTVLYFGSFNANEKYVGIGAAMLESVMQDKLSENSILYAHCDPENSISQKYIEDGFTAIRTVSPAGKFSLEIWRSTNANRLLRSKELDIEDLVEQSQTSGKYIENVMIREKNVNDSFPELAAGDIGMTRYFKSNKKIYVVFEKLSTEVMTDFNLTQSLQKAA